MIILRERFYREKVPNNIAAKGKKEGVIQKDQNGDWRIISYKQNPPEFWDAHYNSKEDAEKALGAYHAQKHYSNYDGVSDDDLDDEIYRRALKKHRRRQLIKGTILGGVAGALGGLVKSYLFHGSRWVPIGTAIGAGSGALGAYCWGKFYQKDADAMKSKSFKKILNKEYEKAYKDRPHLNNNFASQQDEDDDDNEY